MSVMAEIQKLALPAAVGTVGLVYSAFLIKHLRSSAVVAYCFSNIMGMTILGKVRYDKNLQFQHPYKPWSDDHNDKEGAHYRGFKACQNCVEWTVYTLPVLWLNVLYAPALEVVPTVGPVVAPYLPWVGCALSMGYSYFNVQYIKGYMKSGEDRLAPFYARTRCLRLLFITTVAGIACSALSSIGAIDALKTAVE